MAACFEFGMRVLNFVLLLQIMGMIYYHISEILLTDVCVIGHYAAHWAQLECPGVGANPG